MPRGVLHRRGIFILPQRGIGPWNLGGRRGHLAAATEGFAINLPALPPGERSVSAIEKLQALADRVGPSIGDGPFRDQAAAQWDLADQFAGQRTPAKRTGGNGKKGALLVDEAHFFPIRGGDEERHPDLIASEENRVGGKLADDPR